jgi:hypothetical protein
VPNSLCLQDWLTVGGAANYSAIQAVDDYLDLSPFGSVAVYVDISAYSGTPTPTLYLETSPAKIDSFFAAATNAGGASTRYTPIGTGAQSVIVVRFEDGGAPAARWLRWRISSSGAWSMTFRVWFNVVQSAPENAVPVPGGIFPGGRGGPPRGHVGDETGLSYVAALAAGAAGYPPPGHVSHPMGGRRQ